MAFQVYRLGFGVLLAEYAAPVNVHRGGRRREERGNGNGLEALGDVGPDMDEVSESCSNRRMDSSITDTSAGAAFSYADKATRNWAFSFTSSDSRARSRL
jgi:hypothetical protein